MIEIVCLRECFDAGMFGPTHIEYHEWIEFEEYAKDQLYAQMMGWC